MEESFDRLAFLGAEKARNPPAACRQFFGMPCQKNSPKTGIVQYNRPNIRASSGWPPWPHVDLSGTGNVDKACRLEQQFGCPF